MDKHTRDVLVDLVAMLEVYIQGKTNNATRGQAIATLYQAYKIIKENTNG